jgi:hypothetical protein
MRLPIAAFLVLGPALIACAPRDDDYLLLRRAKASSAREAPRLELASANDAEAYYVRHLLASGFGAELLRTYAMSKRFAADTAGRAHTPTTIALGPSDASEPHAPDRAVKIGWWRTTIAGDARIIWIDDSPERRDRSTMADLVSGLGEAIVDTVAPETERAGFATAALRAGYVDFLKVVAAEWRPPRATDDRDDLRRLRVFADVRSNHAVLRQGGRPREMLGDPAVVATVLYRMASSELALQMADRAVYRPFLEVQPPRDVHPALLLGAFRNFQAKLLAAWSRAEAAHRPPHDVIDLVEAYADAYPAERAAATRIFLVTTYGATALPGAVQADGAPERVESELAMLTADVLFGRRRLRDGVER